MAGNLDDGFEASAIHEWRFQGDVSSTGTRNDGSPPPTPPQEQVVITELSLDEIGPVGDVSRRQALLQEYLDRSIQLHRLQAELAETTDPAMVEVLQNEIATQQNILAALTEEAANYGIDPADLAALGALAVTLAGDDPIELQAFVPNGGAHGFWYYLVHPSAGEGPGYRYYLTHPWEMDAGLETGFYVSGGIGIVAGGIATGGIVYWTPAVALPTVGNAIVNAAATASLAYRVPVTMAVRLQRFFATATGYEQVIRFSYFRGLVSQLGWQWHHWWIPASAADAAGRGSGLYRLANAGWNLIPVPRFWNRMIGDGGIGYEATRYLIVSLPSISFGSGVAFGTWLDSWFNGDSAEEE